MNTSVSCNPSQSWTISTWQMGRGQLRCLRGQRGSSAMWGERCNNRPWVTSPFHRCPLLGRSPQAWCKRPVCSWLWRQSRQGWTVVSPEERGRGSSADWHKHKREKQIWSKKQFTPFVSYGQVMWKCSYSHKCLTSHSYVWSIASLECPNFLAGATDDENMSGASLLPTKIVSFDLLQVQVLHLICLNIASTVYIYGRIGYETLAYCLPFYKAS